MCRCVGGGYASFRLIWFVEEFDFQRRFFARRICRRGLRRRRKRGGRSGGPCRGNRARLRLLFDLHERTLDDSRDCGLRFVVDSLLFFELPQMPIDLLPMFSWRQFSKGEARAANGAEMSGRRCGCLAMRAAFFGRAVVGTG
mgnify:CR=1 FL=1